MWFKQFWGRNKREASGATATANAAHRAAASTIENPPVKVAAADRRDATAAHRQPLGVVSNQLVDRHRPAEDEGKKPAKTARIDPAATAPALPPSILGTAAASAKPAAKPVAPAPAAPAPAPAADAAAAGAVVLRAPDMAARRKEFGPCPADIDSADVGDPMFCSVYVQEIYDYLREKEVMDAIDCNYMSRQDNVSARMRTVLVDWMVEVQLKFRMTSETLYLSVNIVDKFLQRRKITRDNLQLLGVTALFIAAKFEEIYSVEINDLAFITDNACNADDIIRFEGEVLTTIGWNLTTPCPLHFLRRYSKAAGNDGPLHTMSKYLLELSLGFYHMLKYLPSTQAAAAVLLTRHLSNAAPYWSDSVKYHSGYREDEIIECARAMLELVKHPDPKFRLVYRKYCGPKLCSVSRVAADNAEKVTL